MPFDFNFGDDGPSVEAAVFQALGFASTCWDSMANTGVFRSDDAKEAGDALVKLLREVHEPHRGDAIEAWLTRCLAAANDTDTPPLQSLLDEYKSMADRNKSIRR